MKVYVLMYYFGDAGIYVSSIISTKPFMYEDTNKVIPFENEETKDKRQIYQVKEFVYQTQCFEKEYQV